MQNAIIDKIERAQEKKKQTQFSVGDRVTVSVRLKEGDKTRVQPFKGVVIAKSPKSGRGPNATFTVRKISEGIGVERVFPVHSPSIEKIKVESSGRVRRSRIYFLRNLSGKKARLKEIERKSGFADLIVDEPEPEILETAPITEEGAPTEESAKAPAPAEAQKAPATDDSKPKGDA